jgi:endoglucanase
VKLPSRKASTWPVLCVLLAACGLVQAAQAAPAQFKDGDTVCVIGDSITHGGRYHSFVYLFYATRFPDRKIKMHNCGISGDTAAGACRRFDWDIAVHKPTAATILLGMNDVGRNFYGKEKSDAKSKQQQKAAIDAYVKNMGQLAEDLRKIKCRMIFLTPTTYEQNAEMETPNFYGCNDGLANCGKEVKKLAKKFHSGLIDVHALMDEVNEKGQKEDKAFTIVGKDRVHPGDVGHFVVAYAILKAQGMPAYVSKMVIDAEAGKAKEEENCKISALKAAKNEVSFECLENALPYPVPDAAKDALKLVPFEKEMNQEVLEVIGLAPGAYELLIDNESVGEYSADELKTGVNLAANTNTPQYKQALAVGEMNSKRQSLESARIRAIACVRHGMLSKVKVDPNDFEAAKKVMLDQLEKMKDSQYYAYNKAMVDAFIKYKPEEKETITQIEDAMTGMYETAKPKTHTYMIRAK